MTTPVSWTSKVKNNMKESVVCKIYLVGHTSLKGSTANRTAIQLTRLRVNNIENPTLEERI